jgi:DNA-binding GntR family transcriptional regulator
VRKKITLAPASELIADQAYAEIQRLIVTGALRPGALVSESALSEQIDCGRTPIREALQRLQLEGFVEIHPRRGALVTTFDIHKQLELIETRRPLELLMVQLAARRADADTRREMLKLADDLEAAVHDDDRGRYFGINKATHDIEAEAAKNPTLEKIMANVHALSRRFWYTFITDSKFFSGAAEYHCNVLRAIARSDTEAAVENAGKLMGYLEKVTLDTIARDR